MVACVLGVIHEKADAPRPQSQARDKTLVGRDARLTADI